MNYIALFSSKTMYFNKTCIKWCFPLKICSTVGDSVSKYRVVCGEHNLRRTDRHEVTMQVTDIKMHPDYWSASKSGRDIAIYKVRETSSVYLIP